MTKTIEIIQNTFNTDSIDEMNDDGVIIENVSNGDGDDEN